MVVDPDPEADTMAGESLGVTGSQTSLEGPRVLLAGRYELLGMLGTGGMGTVYRARDRELDELVALKVLKKELATPEMIERFRREVKLARRVTHRNVARTYDIGEHGGDRFLTMEFVEGEMLAALLARRGRLEVPEVVRLALDVCAGLSAAHAAGVLHRDLKPENVIVAKDGRAVITDFGIARAVAAGELSRTIGGLVGTPAYMAPEQVEGATDLDARADLYALGTMLFELLTGEMAWPGDSIVTVATSRLLRPPPDARSVLPSLDSTIAEIVLKLMARKREDRFGSADEVARALDAVTSVPRPPPVSTEVPRAPRSGTLPLAPRLGQGGTPGSKVVAVLPVLNLGSSDDAYLVENVHEDIVDQLSVVPRLLVRPRGDTARFVDRDRDVRTIGRSLGADVVVDGSLRRIGDKVRASFRVIAVENGFQLWARRFDRPPAEVLSIADEAAQAIAGALTTEVVACNRQQAADPEAEELFLRGRYLMRRTWHGTASQAIDLLARANERAPDNPRILAFYSMALARLYANERNAFDVAERVREMAKRSLELDPNQPEAKAALAALHIQNGQPDAAVSYLRDTLAVAPNSIDALDGLGRIMAEIGRVPEAVALLERASAIDPEFIAPRLEIGRILGCMGDREGMKRAMGEPPKDPGDVGPWFLVYTRHALWFSDRAEAARLARTAADADIPKAARAAVEGLLGIALGRYEPLYDSGTLDRLLPIDSSCPPRRTAFYAQVRTEMFASAGDLPRALESLEAADANGLYDVVFLERCPLLAPMRDHPRFVQVRERTKLRAYRIAAALDARRLQASR
jgi:serine/threonine-protein kinase